MALRDWLVWAADQARRHPTLQWVTQSPLFFTLKEEVLRALLIEFGGMPVDSGIRTILRQAQAKRLPRVLTSGTKAPRQLGILLIQPPLPSNRRGKVIIPVGMASLAAVIRERLPSVEVGLLDSLAFDLSFEETLQECRSERFDIIGLSTMTCQAPFAYRLADAIKQEFPHKTVIFGGVHPTLCPDETLTHGDAAIIGEGELTLVELLERRLQGTSWSGVPGTVVKEAGQITRGPTRDLIADLDSLPFPAYDLLPVRLYNNPLHVVGGERLPIFASRGCPYGCSFCNSPQMWRRRVRYRSAKNVLAEVDWLVQRFGIRQFHFWDDNITLNTSQIEEICAGLESRGDIRWVALDRADHLVRNARLLPVMKSAGCVGIELGVESVNPDTFAYIHKGQAFQDAREAVRLQKEAGLAPLYTCMAFNPGETVSGYRFQKTFLDEIQEGLPWYAFFHQLSFPIYLGQFATPYPGTPFLEGLADQGMDLARSFADRTHHSINFLPRTLLEDVPVVVEMPTVADRDMFAVVAMTGLWDWFDGRSTRDLAAAKLDTIMTIVRSLFREAQGKKSVGQIAEELAARLAHQPDAGSGVRAGDRPSGPTGNAVTQGWVSGLMDGTVSGSGRGHVALAGDRASKSLAFGQGQASGVLQGPTGPVSRAQVFQIVAFACYIFGQTGHLSSRDHRPEPGFSPAHVPIPRFYRRLVRNLRRNATS